MPITGELVGGGGSSAVSVSSLGTTGTGLVSGALEQSGENIVLRAAAEEIFPHVKFLSDFDSKSLFMSSCFTT